MQNEKLHMRKYVSKGPCDNPKYFKLLRIEKTKYKREKKFNNSQRRSFQLKSDCEKYRYVLLYQM